MSETASLPKRCVPQINMRPSRVLRKLRAGKCVSCVKLNLGDARVAEMAASYGFDALWLGMEHLANTWEQIENQVRAAKAYDVDCLVRVSRGSYSDLIRALELDAAGLIIPHVMSVEEAKDIVKMTRFYPLGRRAVDGGNADARYTRVSGEDYLKQSNREKLICVQIEDPESLEVVEEIAAVEGIDMLFFGPGDYSHSIGVFGQMEHPKVVEARIKVGAAARKYGKFAATPVCDFPTQDLAEMGYNFFPLGADIGALRVCFDELAERVVNDSLMSEDSGFETKAV
jgi:4-hydroxy-2-oxoheptanedioate aldolase